MGNVESKPSYFKQILFGAPTIAIMPEKMINRNNWKVGDLRPLLTNTVLNDDGTKPRLLAKLLILELKLEKALDINDLISSTEILFQKSKIQLVNMLKELGDPIPKRFKTDIVAQIIILQRGAPVVGQPSSSPVVQPVQSEILEIAETVAAMTPTELEIGDPALLTSVWESEITTVSHTDASFYREGAAKPVLSLSTCDLVKDFTGDGHDGNNGPDGIAFDSTIAPRTQSNASTPINSSETPLTSSDTNSEIDQVELPLHENLFNTLEMDPGSDEW